MKVLLDLRRLDDQQVTNLESATSGSAAKTSVAFRPSSAFKVQSTGTKGNRYGTTYLKIYICSLSYRRFGGAAAGRYA